MSKFASLLSTTSKKKPHFILQKKDVKKVLKLQAMTG